MSRPKKGIGQGSELGLGPVRQQGIGSGLGRELGLGLGQASGPGLGLDVDLNDVILNRVYAFCDMVLTALDVKQGPAHIEVMILPPSSVVGSNVIKTDSNSSGNSDSSSSDSDSSSDSSNSSGSSSGSSSGGSIVLIEANCGRWHGQDIVHLCNAAYDYNAPALSIIALLAAWDEQEALHHWLNIPTHPHPPKVPIRND